MGVLDDIVAGLLAADPVIDHDDHSMNGWKSCVLCGAGSSVCGTVEHEPTCPKALAEAWAKRVAEAHQTPTIYRVTASNDEGERRTYRVLVLHISSTLQQLLATVPPKGWRVESVEPERSTYAHYYVLDSYPLASTRAEEIR